jgi:hypothetical protein
MKLSNVTFTLHEPPMKHLLWCDRVPRGKRNKPAKLNGITITDTVETRDAMGW